MNNQHVKILEKTNWMVINMCKMTENKVSIQLDPSSYHSLQYKLFSVCTASENHRYFGYECTILLLDQYF